MQNPFHVILINHHTLEQAITALTTQVTKKMPIQSLMQKKKQWEPVWAERAIKKCVANELLYTEANKRDEEVWLAAAEGKVLGRYFYWYSPASQSDLSAQQGEKVLEHSRSSWKERQESSPQITSQSSVNVLMAALPHSEDKSAAYGTHCKNTQTSTH